MVTLRRFLPGRRDPDEIWALPEPAIPEPRPVHPEPSLLDRILPRYDFRGVERITIDASPPEIFQALRTVTLAEMRVAYWLGSLRYLPGRLLGKNRPPDDQLDRPFLEMAMPIFLGEDPGRELVTGTVGKLHNLVDQQFVELPDLFTFTRFNEPGYEKFAMNFLVVPNDHGGSTLVSDHRTLALGPSARWKFAIYWYLLVGWGGNLMLRQLLHAVKRRAERTHASP